LGDENMATVQFNKKNW